MPIITLLFTFFKLLHFYYKSGRIVDISIPKVRSIDE